jgi:hypothetical protein
MTILAKVEQWTAKTQRVGEGLLTSARLYHRLIHREFRIDVQTQADHGEDVLEPLWRPFRERSLKRSAIRSDVLSNEERDTLDKSWWVLAVDEKAWCIEIHPDGLFPPEAIRFRREMSKLVHSNTQSDKGYPKLRAEAEASRKLRRDKLLGIKNRGQIGDTSR